MGIFKQIYISLKVLLRIFIVTLNNIFCAPTYFIWILTFQPLKWFAPQLYWIIEGKLYHLLLAVVASWPWSAGYAIAEAGDDIRPCTASRTLVLVNHQSTGDVPMLIAALNPKCSILPNIMWIMDKTFQYTNFGVVSMIHRDFFIRSGRTLREQAVMELRQHIQNSYIPRKRNWMMLFPEGGFLRKRRSASQKFAAKNNLPCLEHVTLPRLGALIAIFKELHPGEKEIQSKTSDDMLSWVLDITIGYPKSNPIDLPTIIMGQQDPCTTTLFYRLYPISNIPCQKEALTHWLYTLWEEKEHMLDTFYKSGQFPPRHTGYSSSPLPVAQVSQSSMQFLLLHLMFIVSSCFHYNLILFTYYYFYQNHV